MSKVVNSCGRCGKEVYQCEKKIILNKVWHDECFSCVRCKKPLCPAHFSTFKNEIYCRSCYLKENSCRHKVLKCDGGDTLPRGPPCRERTPPDYCISSIEQTRNIKPSEIKQIVKNKCHSITERIDQCYSPPIKESPCCLEQQELLFVSESGSTKIIKVTRAKTDYSCEAVRKSKIDKKITFCENDSCTNTLENPRNSKNVLGNVCEINNCKKLRDNCTNTCCKCKILDENESEDPTSNLKNPSIVLSRKRSKAGDSSTKIERNSKINKNTQYHVQKHTKKSFNDDIFYPNPNSAQKKSAQNSKKDLVVNKNIQGLSVDKNNHNTTRVVSKIPYIPPKYNSRQKERKNSHFLENFQDEISKSKTENIKLKTQFASVEDFQGPILKKFENKNTQYYNPTIQYSKIDENKSIENDNTTTENDSKDEKKKCSMLNKLFFFPTFYRRKFEAQKKERMTSGECKINKTYSYEEKFVVTAEICPKKRYIRNSERKICKIQNKNSLYVDQVCNSKKKFDKNSGANENSINYVNKISKYTPEISDEDNKIYNKKNKNFEEKSKKLTKEICNRCQEQVYVMERRITDNGVFHDKCFRCFFCNKFLDSLSLVPKMDEILCKHCYNKFYGPQIYGFGVQNNVQDVI